MTPTQDPKYGTVRLEAVRRCGACNGRGDRAVTLAAGGDRAEVAREPCGFCDGRGETRTPILNPGEPFLLIRGQDENAATMVEIYKAVARPADTADPVRFAATLTERAHAILAWQRDNPSLVRRPD